MNKLYKKNTERHIIRQLPLEQLNATTYVLQSLNLYVVISILSQSEAMSQTYFANTL